MAYSDGRCMMANKRTHSATVPNAIERSSERCLFVCSTVTRACVGGVQPLLRLATCRRCRAACAATPSPPRASPASPVCLPYVSNGSTHTAETSTALRRRRAGFSAFNSMPRPIRTAQGKRDNNRYCPHTRHNVNDSHTPCTIRAAAAHRVPSCGSGAGGWKRVGNVTSQRGDSGRSHGAKSSANAGTAGTPTWSAAHQVG